MKTLICLVLATLMSGCAGLVAQNPGLQKFTRADVQAALSIAQAVNDTQGITCYLSLLAVIPEEVATPQSPTGLISAFETGRTLRMGAQQGLPDSVVSACAPMVLNSQTALLNAVTFLK